MSWDAHLECDACGHEIGWWNFTHNTNGMVRAVLDDAGVVLPDDTRPCRWYDREADEWHDAPNGHGAISWWAHLDGMTGPDGAAYLHVVVAGLEADPERFRAMNPPNGWGDYDSLVKVLAEMRDAVPEAPTHWRASG